MAQRLYLIVCKRAKIEDTRHVVHDGAEPGKAVRQRAVEVEDDECFRQGRSGMASSLLGGS